MTRKKRQPAPRPRLVITFVDGTIDGADADGHPIGAAAVESGWYVIALNGKGTLDLTTMDGPHDSAGGAGFRYIDLEEQE